MHGLVMIPRNLALNGTHKPRETYRSYSAVKSTPTDHAVANQWLGLGDGDGVWFRVES